jgi:hypothetical protein
VKFQCQHEQDLLDAIATRRWPSRADRTLVDHVAACRLCADVAEVALAFLDDRDRGSAEPSVPPASLVWWKAQVRAREEAARLAARPILLIQIVATVCAAAASLALAPAASSWMRELLATFGATGWSALPPDLSVSWILGAAAYVTLPLLAVGVWIVVAPVVVYLALDE